MTLLFIDGFDSYDTAFGAHSGNRWNAFGVEDTFASFTLSTTGGVKDGQCLQMTNSATHIYKYLGAIHNTLIVGFWFKHNTTHTSNRHFVMWHRTDISAGNTQMTLAFNSSQQFTIYRGSLTTLIATGTTVIQQNRWYYVEMKTLLDNVGTYELRIDGVVELSGSADLQLAVSPGADWLRIFHTTANSGSYFIDDLYVASTDGSAPQNDFLGPHYIYPLKPTGDNTVTGTPSTGVTNALLVDEAIADLDTEYVTHATAGSDLYDLEDLATSPSQITAVQVTSVSRKTNSGVNTSRNILKSSATTVTGNSRDMGPGYNWHSDIFELDPNGNVSWSTSAVNAAVAGIERVS